MASSLLLHILHLRALVTYKPTTNSAEAFMPPNGNMLCACLLLWAIQRLPPTLIMNLQFVLWGRLTMALQGQANPGGFGEIYMEIKVCRSVSSFLLENRWAVVATQAH